MQRKLHAGLGNCHSSTTLCKSGVEELLPPCLD